MSLNRKMGLAVAVAVTVIVVLTIGYILLFMRSFRQSEEQNTSQMVEQTIGAFDDELRRLDILNRDWAAWDLSLIHISEPTRPY